MTETNLCGYCVELPEQGRTTAAYASRCPLCKTELGVSASGRRFRIGAYTVPRRWPGLLFVVLGVAASMPLVAWLVLRPSPATERVALAAPPVPIVEPASADEVPLPSAPVNAADVKYFAVEAWRRSRG